MAYFDVQEEDDLKQDLARSAFGDMLLDEDRNLRYKDALISVIDQQHALHQPAHVVDIGTGSGLLSLLAAEAGAETVTAVEMFTPMAKIAEKIFKDSKYSKKIALFKGRSTDLAQNKTEKGNIVVAEVFDSELIGEGALRTFKEAHETLVKSGSRVIPSSARVWLLPVQSSELQKFNQTPSELLNSPLKACAGSAAVFDLQVSQFKDFQSVCQPFVAFSFNFENPDSINYEETVVHKIISQLNGSLDAVIMWWDLDMDGMSTNYISIAPTWIDPKSPWRDHWMQCVYYLPQAKIVEKGQEIKLFCAHDEFSFWFGDGADVESKIKPICTCQMHVIGSRSVLYRMNHLENNEKEFLRQLLQYCQDKSVVCLGEGSLLGLYAAETAKSVVIVEPNSYFQNVQLEYKNFNKLKNVVISNSIEQLDDLLQIDAIISEPFFLSSILPLDNLKFFSDWQTLTCKYYTQKLDCFLKAITLFVMPVEFEHLWKTVAPFKKVQGFDLSTYSKVKQKAIQESDEELDAQPLWEYPSISTGPIVPVFKTECNENKDFRIEDCNSSVSICTSRQNTNALVFWIEVEYHNQLILSSGLLRECKAGERPEWHRGHRQGVHFLQQGTQNTAIGKIDVIVKIGEYFVPELSFQHM